MADGQRRNLRLVQMIRAPRQESISNIARLHTPMAAATSRHVPPRSILDALEAAQVGRGDGQRAVVEKG
jgi:hypothetical protein